MASENSLDRELLLSPVSAEAKEREGGLTPGLALCLSGGGYRAMLFHVGSLWRLNEAGYLPRLQRISSVSGGSLTAGLLGLNWSRLGFDASGVAQAFEPQVVQPIRRFAGVSVDVSSVLRGVFLPGRVSDRVAAAYEKHLFGATTLQDLPNDPPRFVINATNIQSGVLWRFMKPYMRDYRVGEVKAPRVKLAVAVAASSAFPPVLSPCVLKLDPAQFTPDSGEDLERQPYTSRAVLSDGGVYDNLGLETVWKRYDTILVSDAGQKMGPEGSPKSDWGRHALRVLDVIDNQVRSLRKRQLIEAYRAKLRNGTYWGVRTNIADYGLADSLPCPHERTIQLAHVPTRLDAMPSQLQERLINWGYAVCDAAIRRHIVPAPNRPRGFPYPAIGV